MSQDCQRNPIAQMVYDFTFGLLKKKYWKDGHMLFGVIEDDLLLLVKRALELNKEQPTNSAPLLELFQWCEQKMVDCRAIADPDDALSCELAECGFHDFLTMREKVDSMMRAACPKGETNKTIPAEALREIAARIEGVSVALSVPGEVKRNREILMDCVQQLRVS